MTDTKTYVRLKHYPHKGTYEYLNSLPPNIPFRLYKQLFVDGEVGTLVEFRLLHILSSPEWNDIVWNNLEAILIDYYEALVIKQEIMNRITE